MTARARLLAALAICCIALICTTPVRLGYLELPLRGWLSTQTATTVDFTALTYQFPHRVSLQNARIGDFLSCRSLDVTLSPVNFVTHRYRAPTIISHVHADAPVLVVTPELLRFLNRPASPPLRPAVTVSWTDGMVKHSSSSYVCPTGWVSIHDQIAGEVTGSFGTLIATAGFSSVRTGTAGGQNFRSKINVSGPGVSGTVMVNGRSLPNGDMRAALVLSDIDVHGYRIDSGDGALIRAKGVWHGTIHSQPITAAFFRSSAQWSVHGRVTGSALSRFSKGICDVDLRGDAKSVAGIVRASGVSLKSVSIGDASIVLKSSDTGIGYVIDAVFPDVGYTAGLRVSPAGNVSMHVVNRQGGKGVITGHIAPYDLTVDIPLWQLKGNPFTREHLPDLDGSVAIAGRLSRSRSDISMRFSGVHLLSGPSYEGKLRVQGYDGNWHVSCVTPARDLMIKAFSLADGRTELRGAFTRFPLQLVRSLFRTAPNCEGRITGEIIHTPRHNGSARMLVDDLSFGSLHHASGAIDARWDDDAWALRSLSLHTSSGTVIASGYMPLHATSPATYLNVFFHNMSIGPIVVDGRMSYSGFADPVSMSASGTIGAKGFTVNGHVVRSMSIPFQAGRTRLEINDMDIDSCIMGSLSYDAVNDDIQGNIDIAHMPLAFVRRAVPGSASGRITLRGSLTSPRAFMKFSIPETRISSVPCAAEGTVVYRHGTLFTERLIVTSGTGKLEARGSMFPAPYLAVKAQAVPLRSLAALLHIDLLRTTGTLTGSCDISPQAVTVNDATIKISDSEIRVRRGSVVRISDGSILVAADMRNVHAGPLDLFGAVQCKGEVSQRHGERVAVFTLTATKLWINQYFLDRIAVPVSIRKKKVTFGGTQNQPVKLTGSIDMADTSSILFDRCALVMGGRRLTLNGIAGGGGWNLHVKGTALDAGVLSEIVNLPIAINGAVTIDGRFQGSVDQPNLDVSLSLKNGDMSGIPYDTLLMQCYAQRDVLTIASARVVSGKYTVTAVGFVPFYLSAEAKKRAIRQPMNISVKLENGDLSALNGFVDDIADLRGTMNAQIKLVGTGDQPRMDGYVRCSNASFTEKRYFGPLNDVNVTLGLHGNTISIENAQARSGGGSMRLSGTVALSGYVPSRYNVRWYSEGKKGVRLRIPELPIPSPLIKNDEWRLFSNLSHGEPTFDVELKGVADHPVLSGRVELENSRFTYPSVIKKSGEEASHALLSRVQLDLELRAGKNTWYDNELVSVNISGGIRLRGPFYAPHVFGRIESARGTISYFGTEFVMKQASLELVKDAAYLEGEASAEVSGTQQYESDTVQMIIDKTEIQRIKPRFLSKNNPSLPPEKVLARATGIDPENYSGNDRDFLMRQQLIRLIDSTLTTPLARSLLRKSGIADSFKVQYVNQESIAPVQPGNPTISELLYGTKYSVGKNVTNQLQLGYSVTFDQLQNKLDLRHGLEMSYRLQPNTFLKGVYELDTQNPSRQYDKRITLEQQWRFNLFGGSRKKKVRVQ